MKTILIVFVFILAQSFVSDDPCLQWNKGYKLMWNDFLGFPPANPGKDAAATKSGIYCKTKIIGDSLDIEIKACFTREQSWAITERETDYTLNHEQRHFDIAEINARKFRQYASKWDGKYNINSYLSEGYDTYLKSMESMQDIYDNETNHSVNKPFQQKWNQRIDSLLNVYSAYENPLVRIPLTKQQ